MQPAADGYALSTAQAGDRNVYLRGEGDCRTVTIQRDDGSVRRVRRCD
jgi:hypothetical protein